MPSGLSWPITTVSAACSRYWLHHAARAALTRATVAGNGVITSSRPASRARCTRGGNVFGNPHAKTWIMGVPSLWAWQMMWWALGVLVLWFLAYRLQMSTPLRGDKFLSEPVSPRSVSIAKEIS